MNLHTKYIHHNEYDKGEPDAMVEMIDLIAQTDDITINGQPFEDQVWEEQEIKTSDREASAITR